MTRFESLTKDNDNLQKFAKAICDEITSTLEDNIYNSHGYRISGCDACPWTNLCSRDNNGLQAWLNEEVET